MITHNKIILALDTNDLNKALSIIKILDENIIFKLGMNFTLSDTKLLKNKKYQT